MISCNIFEYLVLVLDEFQLFCSFTLIDFNLLEGIQISSFLPPHQIDLAKGPFPQELENLKVYFNIKLVPERVISFFTSYYSYFINFILLQAFSSVNDNSSASCFSKLDIFFRDFSSFILVFDFSASCLSSFSLFSLRDSLIWLRLELSPSFFVSLFESND